jgi:hypothetical protein
MSPDLLLFNSIYFIVGIGVIIWRPTIIHSKKNDYVNSHLTLFACLISVACTIYVHSVTDEIVFIKVYMNCPLIIIIFAAVSSSVYIHENVKFDWRIILSIILSTFFIILSVVYFFSVIYNLDYSPHRLFIIYITLYTVIVYITYQCDSNDIRPPVVAEVFENAQETDPVLFARTPPNITNDNKSLLPPPPPSVIAMCCVCWDAQANTALVTCGHVCMCASCATRFRRCPLCRTNIANAVKLFF